LAYGRFRRRFGAHNLPEGISKDPEIKIVFCNSVKTLSSRTNLAQTRQDSGLLDPITQDLIALQIDTGAMPGVVVIRLNDAPERHRDAPNPLSSWNYLWQI
jgi:hypothetical protein